MEYEVKRSMRARTMRLAVYPDARVVVTVPQAFAAAAIERFVAKHTDWIQKHIARARRRTVIRVQKSNVSALKRQAFTLASERCAHFARIYGVEYEKISIRAQKSRWGSCSRQGNLSFNYKIALLPAHIADYIVVHEICHLIYMNHGKKFWAYVAKTIPHHKTIRRELRRIVVLCE